MCAAYDNDMALFDDHDTTGKQSCVRIAVHVLSSLSFEAPHRVLSASLRHCVPKHVEADIVVLECSPSTDVSFVENSSFNTQRELPSFGVT